MTYFPRFSRRTLYTLSLIAAIAIMETGIYRTWGCYQASEGVPLPISTQGQLNPAQAKTYILEHPDILIIDVRTHMEFNGGHIPGSVNIPMSTFIRQIGSLPSERPLLFVCQRGYRSRQAYKLIRQIRPELHNVHYVFGLLVPLPVR